MLKDGKMKRRVRLITATECLVVGSVYEAEEEEKPKVEIKDGAWKGYFTSDPEAITYYDVDNGNGHIVRHVPASNFELLPMKEVRYKGGWGATHFAYNPSEIHSPLEKDGVYEVVGIQQLWTIGALPEYCYELICGTAIVKNAHSDNFKDMPPIDL